jgi:PAS domain S-box-containing protein
VRRRRATSRKPAKPQQTIKAKRGTAATRNRRLSASSKDRKVARLAREREDPMEQLQLVIDTIPTLVWSYRLDGAFDYVSRRWSEYTGISAQDALGSGWMAAYHPDDIGKHQKKRLVSLVSGEPVINEVRLRRADGQYRWHLIHGVPLRDASGNIVKWYGAAADIEDRKRAEQALRRSERELRDLIETMPAMAVAALPDGSPTFVNRRWTEYTGLSAEDTEGSGWKTAIHPEDFERWLNLWRSCLANGQPFEDEARFCRASDGEYRRRVASRASHSRMAPSSKWIKIPLAKLLDRGQPVRVLRKRGAAHRELNILTPIWRIASTMFWPCETRTSTCRNFATISSGLYRFLAITVLLDVKDIPQVGPLQWGRIKVAVVARHLVPDTQSSTSAGRGRSATSLAIC